MSTRSIPAGLTSLTDFRPSAAPLEAGEGTPASAIRVIAEAHGFVERNPITPRKRRKPVDEPTYSFTARVSIASHDRFVEFCERERISYREGFDRLVRLIDKA